MGQKVHPLGMRLGIAKQHSSVWYAEGAGYAKNLVSDLRIREWLKKQLANAAVSQIDIERQTESVKVIIHTARPGIVIGKKGEDVDRLRAELRKRLAANVQVVIEEVRKPDIDAALIGMNIAGQLERRVMFRRAMKRAVQNAMRGGAQGIRVQVSGRLGGAEIARTEWYREGRVPLHTLRADIDFEITKAYTAYGVIGVKVWVFKGEIKRPGKEESARQLQKAPIIEGGQ